MVTFEDDEGEDATNCSVVPTLNTRRKFLDLIFVLNCISETSLHSVLLANELLSEGEINLVLLI